MIENIQILPCVDSVFVKPKRIAYVQDGIPKTWDMVDVHDSVAVILYHEERNALVVVRQFRPPVYLQNGDGFTYELCAGIVDKNKTLIEIAREEIYEECGYDVPLECIERVTSFHTAVGFAGSSQTLFFARINEAMRVHEGGGIDVESIEVVFLDVREAGAFVLDESKAKTPGLMFAFGWFLDKRR